VPKERADGAPTENNLLIAVFRAPIELRPRHDGAPSPSPCRTDGGRRCVGPVRTMLGVETRNVTSSCGHGQLAAGPAAVFVLTPSASDARLGVRSVPLWVGAP
jgi:hypothetical protein